MLYEVLRTEQFATWLAALRDSRARAKIAAASIACVAAILAITNRSAMELSEMRVDEGPGYRIYFVERAMVRVVLLCGGDKGSQSRDIARAKQLAKDV